MDMDNEKVNIEDLGKIFKLPALGSDMLYLNSATGEETFKNSVCKVNSITISDLRVTWTTKPTGLDFQYDPNICTNAYGKVISAAFYCVSAPRWKKKTFYPVNNNLKGLYSENLRCSESWSRYIDLILSFISDEDLEEVKRNSDIRIQSGTAFQVNKIVTYNPTSKVVCLWTPTQAYSIDKMTLFAFKTHSSNKKFTPVSLENEHLWDDLAGELAKCHCETIKKEQSGFVCAHKALAMLNS